MGPPEMNLGCCVVTDRVANSCHCNNTSIINTLTTCSFILPCTPTTHEPGCQFSPSVPLTSDSGTCRTAFGSTQTSPKLSLLIKVLGVVQLPCTGHPAHSARADCGTGTDAGVKSDPVQDRLLQCCVAWCSKLQHQEVTTCAAQHSSGTKKTPRQPVVEDVTLAARSAEDRLQSGSAKIQCLQHVFADILSSPNLGSSTRP